MPLSPQQLLNCIDSGQLWPQREGAPTGEREDFADVPAAYQTALQVRALRCARGERPVGYKVGFTNRSIWPRYNVFAPIWGTVWDSTLRHAPQGLGRLALAGTCQPRIEPELVFAFQCRPPAGCSLQQLFDCLDWLAPGFEIVQCHLPGWKFQAAQTVADSGLHARLLVGPQVPVANVAPNAQALEALLAQTRVQLQRDHAVVDEGLGSVVLGSPLQALLHFVNELRACPGAPDIQAPDVVTTGTWTDAWPVEPGQHWAASFSAALPRLELGFD
jgi:2-keto-4-pentenoate hydratase